MIFLSFSISSTKIPSFSIAKITLEMLYLSKFLHNSKIMRSPEIIEKLPSLSRITSPYKTGRIPRSSEISIGSIDSKEISFKRLIKILEG